MRPNTIALVEALILDEWPSSAVQVDFGLDGWDGMSLDLGLAQSRYAALQRLVKTQDDIAYSLDKALGNGPALTVLCETFGIDCEFQTAWDDLQTEEEFEDER